MDVVETYIKLRNKIMLDMDELEVFKKLRNKIMGGFKTYKHRDGRNKCYRHIKGHTGVVCSCVTPDGKNVVSGSRHGTVRITRFDNGKLVRYIRYHLKKVNMVCVTPDSRYVLSLSKGYVHITRIKDGKLFRDINVGYGVTSICVSPDGKHVVFGL